MGMDPLEAKKLAQIAAGTVFQDAGGDTFHEADEAAAQAAASQDGIVSAEGSNSHPSGRSAGGG